MWSFPSHPSVFSLSKQTAHKPSPTRRSFLSAEFSQRPHLSGDKGGVRHVLTLSRHRTRARSLLSTTARKEMGTRQATAGHHGAGEVTMAQALRSVRVILQIGMPGGGWGSK